MRPGETDVVATKSDDPLFACAHARGSSYLGSLELAKLGLCHGGEQIFLVLEMVVGGRLRNAGRACDRPERDRFWAVALQHLAGNGDERASQAAVVIATTARYLLRPRHRP